MILTYVDDFLVLGSYKSVQRFTTKLTQDYEITRTPINKPCDFLGMQLSRKATYAFVLHQQPFIEQIVSRFPVIAKLPHKETSLPVDIHRSSFTRKVPDYKQFQALYRELLGSIMYLRLTRPELLHALQLLSQFAGDPSETAVAALVHCLGFIVATKTYAHYFHHARADTPISVVGVTDATWATNKKNGKSLGAHFLFIGHSLVQASSKKQRYVATSSASAELCQLFIAAKRIHPVVLLLRELELRDLSVSLLIDSLSTVCTLEKPLQQRQKHLALYIHYLRELQARFGHQVLFIQRDQNLADMNTKQVSTKGFVRMVEWLHQPFVWRHVLVDNSRHFPQKGNRVTKGFKK